MQTYQHWKLKKDSDSILWLILDRQGTSVNTLNADVMLEFEKILDEIEKDKSIVGVVLCSGKETGFIAGADIDQFTKFKDEKDAYELVRKVQQIFDRFEKLPIPTVALIDGFCLGGGTEFALACHYRIAEDGPKTRIGLPEVLLGIHPGWGGCVRLPRLIGAPMALFMIVTGKTENGRKAAKLGIVDEAVPRRQLEHAARFYVLNKPRWHRPGFLMRLTNSAWIRPLLAKKFYSELRKKVREEHYPAPYAVIRNWQKYGVQGEKPMIVEAKSIAHFFLQETSKNLVRVFFLQERLKGLGKGTKFSPQHIHVIGAGTMGGDIAAWCALQGFRVSLQDREPKFIAPAIKRAYTLYKEKFRTPRDIQAVMDRLIPDPEGLGVGKADIIIEAIYENLEAKQQLFKSLESQAKPTAILATNTSSIPLNEISQAMQHPERLVGIHFFNPVAKMKLVEVVQGENTDVTVMKDALAFVRKIDRLPLPVKSSPGFLVNRVLMPYLMESMMLLEEGVPATAIDDAAVRFGMPMGPVELADTVGLDVCLSVAENLTKHYGGTVSQQLRDKVKNKQLGRKTGEGFYVYRHGKAVKPKEKTPVTHDVTDRLILRMLNEAVACLREKVVEDSDLLDAGMVYGTGFAPFRGGPIKYAKTRGINAIRDRLIELAQKYGGRFKPDSGWETL